jgi:hypothetical protein
MRYNTGMNEPSLSAQSEHMSDTSTPSSETAMPAAADEIPVPAAAAPAVAVPRPPKKPTKGRIFRRTSYAQAVIEGVIIFAAYRLLEMLSRTTWDGIILILFFFLLLVLEFLPPVWAASRVVSTKREKMSKRFWKMGPILAGLCILVDVGVTLWLGNASLLLGPDGNGSVWARLQPGAAHPLTWAGVVTNEIGFAVFLLIYFVIAVVSTRLANGGFMRFTMPSGNGRVTL